MKTMMFGITLSMILTISLTLIPGSIAQNSPVDYLRVHNAARAAVGVGPLTWNATLASYAQNYANQRARDCQLIHSNGPYGENLAEGSWPVTGAEAVSRWVGEKPNYDYKQNKCVRDQCLHYTQVVWKKSTSVGCGRVKCNSGWWFIGCNYYPPGNYVGERPY